MFNSPALTGFGILHLSSLHRLIMADTFPATGLFEENDVPTDIAPVHFTGFRDILL